MRKVILGLAVSLDGFIEGPDRNYDWCFTDQDYGMTSFMKSIDAIFIGRKTFEITGGNPFPQKNCYVFSNTLCNLPQDAELIRGDIAEKVKTIKNKKGKDIWLFGGAGLTNSLLQLGLIDIIQLAVHPILLGIGKPLFDANNSRIDLALLNSKTFTNGLVSLSYQVQNKHPG